jgi:hypothetical protein
VICPRCSTENNEGNAYCHACGQLIDPKLAAIEASLNLRLGDSIKAAIETKLKDAKILEVEVAEGVAKRLIEWGKILGLFVGVPVALIGLALTIFGIQTFAGFEAKLKEAEEKATESIKERVDKTLSNIDDHAKELVKNLDRKVDESPAVQQIKREVNELKIKFNSEKSVPTDLEQRLKKALSDYQDYLKNIGFQADYNVGVRLLNHPDENDMVSAYYPIGKDGPPEITLDIEFGNSPDPIFLEYTRHVLFNNLLKARDDSPQWWDYKAIESGLGRYYACSFRDQPYFARDAVSSTLPSDLRSKGSVINRSPDWNWGNIEGATLWGALCWEIRELLGKKRADVILREAWFDLDDNDLSNSVPEAFSKHLLARARDIENGQFIPKLMEVLKSRGL